MSLLSPEVKHWTVSTVPLISGYSSNMNMKSWIFSLVTILPHSITDVKNHFCGDSSQGTSNPCKAQTWWNSWTGLLWCLALSPLSSPPKPWLLCQSHYLPPSHMTFHPLFKVLFSPHNFSFCVTELHLSHSQGQSLPSVNGCCLSGLKHTSLVLSTSCSSILRSSSVRYSHLTGKVFHLSPKSVYIHLDTSQERELGKRHCSPSLGGLYLNRNRAKQMSTYMAIYIVLLYFLYIHRTPVYISSCMGNTGAQLPSQTQGLAWDNCPWISISNTYHNTDLEISVTQRFPSLCYGPWLASLCFPWWHIPQMNIYTNISKYTSPYIH